MPRRLTLVMEAVDILFKIVDKNSEQLFPLLDQSMHQIAIPSRENPTKQEVVSSMYLYI